MPPIATSIPPAELDEPRFTNIETKRAHVRVKVELEIKFSSVHNFYAGFVENLSAGGIFIATYKLRPVGETVAFEVTLPGCETPVSGVGEVRWVRQPHEDSDVGPGMGIRFMTLNLGSAEAIRRYVERRDPMFYDE